MLPDYDTGTPAVLFMVGDHAWDYGALATVRTLGRAGIPVHVVLNDADHPVTASRYTSSVVLWDVTGASSHSDVLSAVRRACAAIGQRAVAIASDDEAAVVLAAGSRELREVLILPDCAADLAGELASKEGLARLCRQTGTPTPASVAPRSMAEVEQFLASASYPLVVKNPEPFSRLVSRGVPATTRVADEAELRVLLAGWDGGAPLLVQEYLAPDEGQDWYVAGVIGLGGEEVVAFSGRKLRAFPPSTGVGTLGESRSNPELIATAVRFAQQVGYRGVFDTDWRLDPRDGSYKLLDFNPRRGAQFRLFRSEAGVDVVRALHLTLTGREVPKAPQVDGIRHVVGILDQKAYRGQRRTGSPEQPLVQGRGAERAWWAADDPRPALVFASQLGPFRKVRRGSR